ncbi:hypothetical protein Rumeso_04042 [Rubellimicrobium mesophilum DSM 19309]|uniref:Uncharacterized protein n=1 Tax=Rubellimicrobium mesophilum DSM 19309 TaxID=442562 RepID=A0A017HIM1_9RHOB|nr:hypothetical protein [Rubellimicrobium mesophilum]EYD74357.1 hypothetical protein Rumeso_04042 [Rubellimicrobium mesophilum DSM 19309]
MEEALAPAGSMDPPTSEAAHAGQEPALALHMGLPGTRLDMVLGGPHPLLVALVRHLARVAARADHAGMSAITNNDDTTEENL